MVSNLRSSDTQAKPLTVRPQAAWIKFVRTSDEIHDMRNEWNFWWQQQTIRPLPHTPNSTHTHTPHTHTPTHPTRKSRRNYCTKGTTKEGELHNDNRAWTVHYTTTNSNTLLYLTYCAFPLVGKNAHFPPLEEGNKLAVVQSDHN